MDSHSIPIDLILEILSRLPAESVKRFHCVSKVWASMLGRPYFTELFLTRSSAKPRLLLAIEEDGLWSFFSLPQLQSPYEKSSSSSTIVVAAEFHAKLSPNDLRIYHYTDRRLFSCVYASGLIYLYGCRYKGRPVVCDPNTGRYATLPYLQSYRKSYSFFGFEPIDKQYKVLFMAYPFGPGHHKVLTIETGDMRWRKIKCSLKHDHVSEGICINGVLYYLGYTWGCTSINLYLGRHDVTSDFVIVCFDVRSEKFTFIDVGVLCKLINNKGKLAVIYWKDVVNDDVHDYGNLGETYWEFDVDADAINELHVWVLEGVEKPEWSKSVYTLSDDKLFSQKLSLAGATASGEIVFSMCEYTPQQPFYVFYFNPERNNLRCVEIQGFGEAAFKKLCGVCTFVDHIEDLNLNDSKLLKSVHPPYVEPEYFSESDSE